MKNLYTFFLYLRIKNVYVYEFPYVKMFDMPIPLQNRQKTYIHVYVFRIIF